MGGVIRFPPISIGPVSLRCRRLNDLIVDLCRKVVAMDDDDPELADVLQKLKAALHEHAERLRARAAAMSASERRDN